MTPEEVISKWTDVVAADGWGGNSPREQLDEAAESLRVRIAIRALVTLLINKGVFTQTEWQAAQSSAADHFDSVLTNRFPRSV